MTVAVGERLLLLFVCIFLANQTWVKGRMELSVTVTKWFGQAI